MFRTTEQANFAAVVARHIAQPDGPLLLEGGTGLGKTRAYLRALTDAAAAGKQVVIALPSHQLMDQLLASQDLQATRHSSVAVRDFRPARRFATRAEYLAHRRTAIDADVMVCTSAALIIDQRLDGSYNGATLRDYIVFDEADQLPDAAALQSDCEIKAGLLKELGIPVHSAEQAAKAVLLRKDIEPEVRAAALMVVEAIEEPAWFYKAGLTDTGDLRLWHRMPGRLLKKIANRSSVAFLSATLSIANRFDDFQRAMGIAQPSALSCAIEPARHGSLRFHVVDVGEVPDGDEALQAHVRAIVANAPPPVLVAVPSHDLANRLGAHIPDATVQHNGESASEAAARMGHSTVLIAAGAWAGMDTPTRWASIVVPRIPFGRPESIDGQVESSYLDSRNMALRRMRQVIGRGLRTPDAVCDIFITDARYRRIAAFVPRRFEPEWKAGVLEGGRSEVVLSKLERDPTVRKRALRHYGPRCQGCGLSPKSLNQLDVHHLQPLADGGERLTGLQDVAVLCANCHRLAHSQRPPLAVDVIREINDYAGA